MYLPTPRGHVSHAIFGALRGEREMPKSVVTSDPDDLQISLWALYELRYRGFVDVADDMEWEPGVLAIRRRLEELLESELRGLSCAG